MAKKNEIKGGLTSLFNKNRKTTSQPTEENITTAPEVTTPEVEEDDIINTIEDEELRAALHAKRMDGRGRPRKNTDKFGNRTDGYNRTSIFVKDDKIAKIREIAFQETLTMREIFEYALDKVIAEYESTHGEVIPRPERYKGDINSVFNKDK